MSSMPVKMRKGKRKFPNSAIYLRSISTTNMNCRHKKQVSIAASLTLNQKERIYRLDCRINRLGLPHRLCLTVRTTAIKVYHH